MRVASLVDPGQPLQLGTADKPMPAAKEVVVKVETCGLVPNTHNVATGDREALPELPAVFGLDVAGVVESVGSDVLNLSVGDRVYVDPHLVCDTCFQCRAGRKDLCEHIGLRGYLALRGRELLEQTPIGGLAEYVLAQDRSIVRLPDQIDFNTAARLGYLGTSFAALRKGGVEPGTTVLINGVTGTLGVAAVAIALGLGATRILGIGRNTERLEAVRTMAPDRVTVVSSEDVEDLAAWALAATDGAGADVLYHCLGGDNDDSLTALQHAVRHGGAAVLASAGSGTVEQATWDILMRDVTFIGSVWFTSAEIDRMIAMIAAGVIDLNWLEHHTYPLDDVNTALERVGERPGGFTNIVVTLPA